jgi:antimicrobial peptide system SdpB family protein
MTQNSGITAQYHSNVLGLVRSLLAFGTLSTLLFNSHEVLFSTGLENEIGITCNKLTTLSIFCILKEEIAISYTISISILIISILGFLPRYFGVLHWWITYSLSVSGLLIDGGDQLASILTLLLIPITLTDSRVHHWSLINNKDNIYKSTISNLAVLLIKIQIAVVYFHASTGKFFVNEWINGTAIYYWFSSSNFGAPYVILDIIDPFLRNPYFITFTTWLVIILELLLATSIFSINYKYKKLLLWIGLLFHFGIIVIHGLFSFFFTMAASLVLLLAYPKYNYIHELFPEKKKNFLPQFVIKLFQNNAKVSR